MGFDKPKKIMGNAQGGRLAAPAWTAMMRDIYERRAIPPAWPRPDGLTALDIDKTTGYKATPFCPKDVHYIESFIPGTEPNAFCPIHSPFGSVGGVMGGSGPGPGDGAPPSTAPAVGAPPAVAPPAKPGQPQAGAPGRPATPPATGTGAMGGTGPSPISQ